MKPTLSTRRPFAALWSLSARVAAATLVSLLCAGPATADWKPTGNVELIPPGNPGNSVDRVLRLVDTTWKAMEVNGFTTSVVNKPGGGQSVAWSYLNEHPGDARYLSVTSPTLLISNLSGKTDVSYKTDVVPVAMLLDDYVAIVVRADSPLKTGQDLIDKLKGDPRSLSIALSPGLGGPNHLALSLALKNGGVDITKLKTVIFSGSSKAVTNVIGGHVDLSASPTSTARKHLEAGKIRVLAITAPKRLGGVYKDVPTWRELGSDAVFANWRMIIAPKGTPPEQIAYYDDLFARTAKAEVWLDTLEKSSWTPNYMDSREVMNYLDAEYTKLKGLMSELGLAK